MRLEGANYSGLVKGMACGDQRAASRLYDHCSPILYALALRIVGDASDAEEVVLDVFIQAWSDAADYRDDRSSVLSWLSMITRSRSLDRVRTRARRSRAVARAVTGMGDEPVAISAGSVMVSESLEQEERAIELTRALQQLSNPQRAAIELAYFTGLTHLEIANRLGEPLGTIKTRIRLAILRMRDTLSGTVLKEGITASSGRIGWAG
ncbi:MAG: sigma-70 family RNA polymerase sigma factor [Gemmatimonadaceae bacterium]